MEVRVVNGTEDHETRVNEAEANHIIELISDMVNNKEYDELTIGVISPFRPQADYINLSLLETFGEKICKKYMLHADTADGFQGDERDVIIYSLRQAPNSKPGAITAIQSDQGRVNVMFTRARRKVIAVTSIPIDHFPEGGAGEISFKNYLNYSNEISKRAKTEEKYDDKFQSKFEEDVCGVLRQQPWIKDIRTQVAVIGSEHSIDLVIRDYDGRRLAVECDGPQHYDEYSELIIDDIWRQLYIERTMGISFYRIPATKWYRYKNEVLKELEEVLKDQETEADRLMISSIVSYEEGISDDEAESKDSREDAVTATDNQEEMKTEEQPLTTEPELSEDKIAEQVVSNEMIQGQINLFDKPKVSAVPKGVPKDWRIWYDISRWGREKRLINDYWWSFAIKAGDKLRNGWDLSDKERNDMVRCWKMATKHGFKYS
jgi:very-short-patch-repair endonuclease